MGMAHYHYLLHNPSSPLISLPSPPHGSPSARTLLQPKTLSCHLSSSHNNTYSSSNSTTPWWHTKTHSKPLQFALSGALSLGLLFGGTHSLLNPKLLNYGRGFHFWDSKNLDIVWNCGHNCGQYAVSEIPKTSMLRS